MRIRFFIIATVFSATSTLAQQTTADHSWIAVSNDFTNQLLKIEMKHNPEQGSRQGLAEYDELVSQPTLADEDLQRKESEEVLAKLKAALPQQKQKEVAQDLEIIIRRNELQFRTDDFQRAHDVAFVNASMLVFQSAGQRR